MSNSLFITLMDLLMTLDPWPANNSSRLLIENEVKAESKKRGYRNWLDAYHHFSEVPF